MSQSFIGKIFDTGERVRIVWEKGKIVAVESTEIVSSQEVWLAPPLLDLQVNGFAGVDFQRDDLTEQDLLKATYGLFESACLKFFLTLITDDWGQMMRRLGRLKQIRDGNALLKSAIVGWHIEGPFLSDKPGFCGAHNPAKMINPTPDHLLELRKIAADDKILLTLAPERDGALEAIRIASNLGITVFLGHTDAPTEVIKQAIQNGVVGFTHLANGCPHLLDRKDNIIWRVLDIQDLIITLIPDKIHVAPSLFRIIHKAKNNENILYISDAISAAGAPPGQYTLGELKVQVASDGIAWNPSKTGYAGSSLCPLEGILRASEMLDESWQEIWKRYSILPAKLVGENCELTPGNDANFVVLRPEACGKIAIEKAYFRGNQVYP